jgi:hypothetical protein
MKESPLLRPNQSLVLHEKTHIISLHRINLA